jgi:ferric-dicitrate binding protein FerR (iron transport regulator)
MSQHNQQKLEFLLQQWAAGQATETELTELTELLKTYQDEEAVLNMLTGMAAKAPEFTRYQAYEVDNMVDHILQKAPGKIRTIRPLPIRRIFAWIAAASIIIIAALVVILNLNSHKQPNTLSNTTANTTDLSPGKQGAILILADGRNIILDSASGRVAQQGNVAVINQGGMVLYHQKNSGSQPAEIMYNTIATPRGRQYQLVLEDGSKVWLNATSSIRFPTAFTGKERRVVITGEAYFEVAKNPAKKFIVEAGGITTEVLGTHFNINSYADENETRVTLLEGAVKVATASPNAPGHTAILKPGEQAVSISDRPGQSDGREIQNKSVPSVIPSAQSASSVIHVIRDQDIEEVMSWKNGYFSFHNADIQTVMRQLARWYDVEVIYQGNLPTAKLEGKIPRNVNASTVLAALQYTGIHFLIDGKKIYVSP